jgi:hypothetical protein
MTEKTTSPDSLVAAPCSAFFAALLRMQARGQTRLSANCLAAEMWPNARHQNSHGQSFNLAAGVAGRMLRKYRACHEVQNRVWEIVPEFMPNDQVEARRDKTPPQQ